MDIAQRDRRELKSRPTASWSLAAGPLHTPSGVSVSMTSHPNQTFNSISSVLPVTSSSSSTRPGVSLSHSVPPPTAALRLRAKPSSDVLSSSSSPPSVPHKSSLTSKHYHQHIHQQQHTGLSASADHFIRSDLPPPPALTYSSSSGERETDRDEVGDALTDGSRRPARHHQSHARIHSHHTPANHPQTVSNQFPQEPDHGRPRTSTAPATLLQRNLSNPSTGVLTRTPSSSLVNRHGHSRSRSQSHAHFQSPPSHWLVHSMASVPAPLPLTSQVQASSRTERSDFPAASEAKDPAGATHRVSRSASATLPGAKHHFQAPLDQYVYDVRPSPKAEARSHEMTPSHPFKTVATPSTSKLIPPTPSRAQPRSPLHKSSSSPQLSTKRSPHHSHHKHPSTPEDTLSKHHHREDPSTPSSSLSRSASSARKRRAETYYPTGQRKGSAVPMSFTGRWNEDGEPEFEDDYWHGHSIGANGLVTGDTGIHVVSHTRSTSIPELLLVEKDGLLASAHLAAVVNLNEKGAEMETASGVQAREKKLSNRNKTLTIFDSFSFPLPPTYSPSSSDSSLPSASARTHEWGPSSHPNPISHRPSASESVIPSSLQQKTNTVAQSQLTSSSQTSNPLTVPAHAHHHHHRHRPLPLTPASTTPPLASTLLPMQIRAQRLRSASAGGIGELGTDGRSAAGLGGSTNIAHANGALRNVVEENSAPSPALTPKSRLRHGVAEWSSALGMGKLFTHVDLNLRFGPDVPLRSARPQNFGIDVHGTHGRSINPLIGMVDAVIAA